MFVDHIKIYAKAGDGGNGCCSFRREKHVPKGGPDGGDGGNGADIILEVDHHTDNLRNFFYRPKWKADKGRPGEGARKTGKSGKALILKVPPGTVVYRCEAPGHIQISADELAAGADFSGEYEVDEEGAMILMDREEGLEEEDETSEEEVIDGPDMLVDDDDFDEDFEDESEDEDDGDEEEKHPFGEVVADLTKIGDRFLLCKGGVGGKGNWNFRTDTNQAPIEFTTGTPGEDGWFYLELRKIADIGLVGFPNAGKSTLLSALSNATPKVAAYPFTTLKPMVGVVEFPGFVRTTVADIPGLIEGAHRNVGLGHDFLRHISRCSVFLFVVDTAAVDLRDPISDIQILRKELKLFDEELSTRPWIIVANKIDLEESELFLEPLKNRFPNQKIMAISAREGDGVDDLRRTLCEMVGKRPE
ncbi:MAG: GTPase Obg [Verrucomicrobiales bacterium]|nr:GTPase Obg [Verrucomicrobiales bacterium]